MKNLYIDVDGVLIGKNQSIAPGIKSFLEIVLNKYACFWLTTHCKGNTQTVKRYLNQLFPREYEKYWESISPTNWDTLKTEAIDYSKDFFWLDDKPLQSEIIYLTEKKLVNKLIVIDLSRENELKRVGNFLKANF